MTAHSVIVERAETGWRIYVPDVDRYTWAPHLREVEKMARDLIQVMTDRPIDDIAVDIQLPAELSAPIQRLHTARGAAADADAAAREAQRVAATTLRDAGTTLRDVAAALNISHQRVHQVLADAAERRKRLNDFRTTVDRIVARDTDVDMVVNDEGERVVVVALGDELLSQLIERLRSAGGYATVFVLSASGAIRSATVVRSECSIAEPDDDLTGTNRPGSMALIDTFIDYLALHPNGVKLDSAATDSHAKGLRTLQSA